MFWERLASVSQ